MANIDILELPVAVSVDGSEYFPLVQGGTTKRAQTGLLMGSGEGGVQNANTVFAGPAAGAAAAPTFRALVAADIPEITPSSLPKGTEGYAIIGNGLAVAPSYQGFVQSEGTAVARTWQSKVGDIICVLDYIPVALHASIRDRSISLSEDLHPYIQECLDENEGRLIYVPSGLYPLHASLVMRNHHLMGDGTDTWNVIFPDNAPSQAYGTHLMFCGTGPAEYEMRGTSDMSVAGGWRTNPDGSALDLDEYYKLLNFMNEDASGTTPATQKLFSAGVYVEPTTQSWSIQNLRIVVSFDGLQGYIDHTLGLADDWDVGLYVNSAEYGFTQNVQIAGYWRMAGCLIGHALNSAGQFEAGAEGNRFYNCMFQGFRGVSIRGGDYFRCTAVTASTIEVPWTASNPLPATATSGLRIGETRFDWTGASLASDKLTLTGVTPNPVSSGVTVNAILRNNTLTTGVGQTSFNNCIIYSLEHFSERPANEPGVALGVGSPIEVNGSRGVRFLNCKIQTREQVICFPLEADDLLFVGCEFEPSTWEDSLGADGAVGARFLAQEVDQAGVTYPAGDTRTMELIGGLVADTVDLEPYVTRTTTRFASGSLFTPRSFDCDQHRFPASQNTVARVLLNKTFEVQRPDETVAMSVDDDGNVMVSSSTSVQAYGQSVTPVLQVNGLSSTNQTSIGISRWSANANAGTLRMAKSRGTPIGTHGAVVASDTLGSLVWEGDDGTNFIPAARLLASVDGTPGTNDMPGRVEFQTTPDGSATLATRFSMVASGIALATGHGVLTGTTSGNTALLRAYNVGGAAYTTFATLTADATTPTMTLSNVTSSTAWSPTTADGAALGSASLPWSDLFLASGGVINWNNGTYTLTQSATNLVFSGTATLGVNGTIGGQVTLNGATSGSAAVRVAAAAGTGTIFELPANNGTVNFVLTTDGNGITSWTDPSTALAANRALSNLASVAINTALLPGVSDSIALGSATFQWSNLFLGSGGIINWDNGDVTITHSANALAFAGASSGYSFDALLTGSLAGQAARFVNTTDSASVTTMTVEGDRATPTNNDITQLLFLLSNSAGTQTACAGVEARMIDVTTGATQLRFLAHSGAANAARMAMTNNVLSPVANDGMALGSTSLSFSDLFLATGGVINWNAGTFTLTQSGTTLTSNGTLATTDLTVTNAPRINQAASTIGTGVKTISNAADSSTNFGKYFSINLNGTVVYIPCGTVAPT